MSEKDKPQKLSPRKNNISKSGLGRKRRAFLFSFILLVIFFLGLFFVLSLFFIFFATEKSDTIQQNNTYQTTVLNPFKNETSIGFARIKRELSTEEYLSYFDPKIGRTTVISNFFDDEFECTGSCYCDEEENRRTSSTLLRRGMIIILSAFSVTMALNIAKETFLNNCQNYLAETCPKMSIKSELDDCKGVFPEGTGEGVVEDEFQQLRSYKCKGYCVQNRDHNWVKTEPSDKFRDINVREARAAFGDCTKLETEGRVDIIIHYRKKEILLSNAEARGRFQLEYLGPFCRSQSLVNVKVRSYSKTDQYFYENKKQFYFKDTDIPACTGYSTGDRNKKCKLIRKQFLDLF